MTLKVSVVVPTYRRPDLLERCLMALLAQNLPAQAFEIIVADDGPTDDNAALVRRLAAPGGPAMHYVAVTRTQGPAGARNAGWRTARADIVAFTDDDTVPQPEWLANGLRAFTAGVSAVCGRVVMPLPDTPTDYELDASGLTRAEFVTANCFVTVRALKEVGGFDERFTLAWREDSDLHFALLSANHTIVTAPDAIVVHPVRPAPPGVSVRQQRKVVFDALLYRKWPRLYRSRIRRRPPWHYFLIVASLLGFVIALLAQSPVWAGGALLTWLVLTLRFCLQRLAHTSRRPAHVLEMLATSALIPPLAVFWRLVGAWRFRTPFV